MSKKQLTSQHDCNIGKAASINIESSKARLEDLILPLLEKRPLSIPQLELLLPGFGRVRIWKKLRSLEKQHYVCVHNKKFVISWRLRK